MPIVVVNVRLLIVKQAGYKPVPGSSSMAYFSREYIYPDDVTATPEELFEQFKAEANQSVFTEVDVRDGATIGEESHIRALSSFGQWLEAKGFKSYYQLEKEWPVLEIPAQVTLTNLRPVWRRG